MLKDRNTRKRIEFANIEKIESYVTENIDQYSTKAIIYVRETKANTIDVFEQL